MEFAHVIGTLIQDDSGFRILITLDTRARITTLRDERIPELMRQHGLPDQLWTVDQLTQETIGTDLAEQGWEALAAMEAESLDTSGPPTVGYVVRRL